MMSSSTDGGQQPMDNNNSWLVAGAFCCVLPTLILIVASAWVIRNGQRYLTPDTVDLHQQFEHMKAQNPQASPEMLVNKIIHRQAIRSGLIGAITSVGGLPFLPFGMTIDLYATARIQNATLHFIAWALNPQGANANTPILSLGQTLKLGEGGQVDQYVSNQTQALGLGLSRRLIEMITEKAFAKLIPGLGLVIGFIVNYAITRGISQLAVRWYMGRLRTHPLIATG
jgi:hypothetical protein